MLIILLLKLFAMAASDRADEPAPVQAASPAPSASSVNHWAEPTRGILAQHCGRCHLPNLPTSIPRALEVFNLTEEPWYGRLTNPQYDSLLGRVKSIRSLTDADRSAVESFVLCARDRNCSSAQP